MIPHLGVCVLANGLVDCFIKVLADRSCSSSEAFGVLMATAEALPLKGISDSRELLASLHSLDVIIRACTPHNQKQHVIFKPLFTQLDNAINSTTALARGYTVYPPSPCWSC